MFTIDIVKVIASSYFLYIYTIEISQFLNNVIIINDAFKRKSNSNRIIGCELV